MQSSIPQMALTLFDSHALKMQGSSGHLIGQQLTGFDSLMLLDFMRPVASHNLVSTRSTLVLTSSISVARQLWVIMILGTMDDTLLGADN